MRAKVYEYISKPNPKLAKELTSMELSWAKSQISERQKSDRPSHREDEPKQKQSKTN